MYQQRSQFITILLTAIVTAFLVLGGAYAWQQMQSERVSEREGEQNMDGQELKNTEQDDEKADLDDVAQNGEDSDSNDSSAATDEPADPSEGLVEASFETHTNRLFTIQYPEGWRAITNEVGGLMEIRQPIDDHSVVSVTYIKASDDDVARCDLSSRNWEDMSIEVVDERDLERLVRYEGTNRLEQTELAYVAISGNQEAIHDCTILEYNDAWVAVENKPAALQMMETVSLRD